MPSAEKAADRTEPLILRLPTHVRVFRDSRGTKPCMKGGAWSGKGVQDTSAMRRSSCPPMYGSQGAAGGQSPA